jgi:hypothetical protein
MLMLPTGDEDSLIESEHEVIYRPAPQELWAKYRSHEVFSHSKAESSPPKKKARQAKRRNVEEMDPSLCRRSKRHKPSTSEDEPHPPSSSGQHSHEQSLAPTPLTWDGDEDDEDGTSSPTPSIGDEDDDDGTSSFSPSVDDEGGEDRPSYPTPESDENGSRSHDYRAVTLNDPAMTAQDLLRIVM